MELNFKYYKTTPLIIAILILALLIDLFLTKGLIPIVDQHFPRVHLIRAPGNATIIGLILLGYNDYLWRYKIFNLLIKIPNMEGRYEGDIKFNWQGENRQKECVVEIKQTASAIKINTYFNNEQDEKTYSTSLIEEICKSDDGFYQIFFFYLNHGSKTNGILDCHEGANVLKFIKTKESKELIGHYFTNRNIQTRGEIFVEFKTKKLKGRF